MCNQSNNLGSNVWSGDRENVSAATAAPSSRASGPRTAYCRNGMSHAQFARSHCDRHARTHHTKRVRVCFIKCYVNAITLANAHGHTQKTHQQFQFSYQDHIDNFSETCLIYKMCVCAVRAPTPKGNVVITLCMCARQRREELFTFARSLYMCVCVSASAFASIKLK